MQAPLNQKQTPQSVFFSEGVAFDGQRLNRTSAAAPFFETWCRLRVWMEVRRRQGCGTAFASLVEPNLHVLGTRVSEGYVSRATFAPVARGASVPSAKLTMARADEVAF